MLKDGSILSASGICGALAPSSPRMAVLGDRLGIVTYNPGDITDRWRREPQQLSSKLSHVIRCFVRNGADVICIQDFALHEIGIPGLEGMFTPLAEDLGMKFHINKGYIAFSHKRLRMDSSLHHIYSASSLGIKDWPKRHWRTVQLLSSEDKQLGVVNVHCPVGGRKVRVEQTFHDHGCTDAIKAHTFQSAAQLASEGFAFSVVCGDLTAKLQVVRHGSM